MVKNSIKNKVAIVTGATRGIGRAIAENLMERECKVIGVYERSDDKAKELEENYSNIKMIKADVGREDIGNLVVDKAISEFKQLDILINNAGIFIGGSINEFQKKDWDRTMAVNITSKYLLSKHAIPFLEKSGNAVIVNISSRFGFAEQVLPLCIAYGVANAAINNFTVGLSKELEDKKIRVNAVIPTVTDTDRFRNSFSKEEQEEIRSKGKLGTPQEAADLVLKLVTDKSKNGEIIIDDRVNITSDA